MEALTPAERRGVILLALLLALGAGHDLWRASRPLPAEPAPGRQAATAPMPGAPREPAAGVAGAGSAAGAGPVLDLNLATVRELESLPGVGPVLAGRIVGHRERHGPFRHPEDLLAVRGIGPRLFERLRGRVGVAAGGSEPGAAAPVTRGASPGAAPPP